MAKPQLVKVPADDCVVEIGGIEHTPHEGEWVEVIPGQTVGEISTLRRVHNLNVRLAEVKGEEDEGYRRLVIEDDAFQEMLDVVRVRLVNWNWTDDVGTPLLNPRSHPEVLQNLRVEEVVWLFWAVKQETPSAEKNASRPLPTSSSGSARARSQK